MPRPKEHRHMPGATTGFPRWEDVCGGDIQVVYARKGTPTQWLKLGEMCLRCHVFYPAAPPAVIGVYRERQIARERNRES